MKAAQISKYGGPEAIEIREIDKPALKDKQVLVEVKAAAINPFDWKLRSGNFRQSIPLNLPITLGADFSGAVKEVAKDVTNIKPGDEVYGSAIVLNGGSGALAEYATANTANIGPKLASLSHEQAAALVLVGISAFQALDKLNLEKGQRLLIQGGAGGIGSAAIQYAKHLGVYVAVIVRETDKVFVRDLGADEVIDYQKEKFEDKLKDFDAVFDTVGGDVYANSFKVLKKGGVIISMTMPPNEELMTQYGNNALYQTTSEKTDSINRLTELIDKGVIKPQIDKEFPLEQTAEAFEHLETGHPKGKVVVKIS